MKIKRPVDGLLWAGRPNMDRTWMPITAGIICIVVGAISLIGGFFTALFAGFFFTSAFIDDPFFFNLPGLIVWAFALPYLIISGVAVAGGVYALRRRRWGLSLAGSICAILTGWAWILGVVAIVFVIMAKDEFDHLSPPPPTVTIP